MGGVMGRSSTLESDPEEIQTRGIEEPGFRYVYVILPSQSTNRWLMFSEIRAKVIRKNLLSTAEQY